ncbi:MAG: DMT family transporter [Actinobacteria bacterium]|nr:DMT family transporter [Actinomycetota bacterium]MCA1721616.1 DMT family transporter [Actinomycetota bacterium]
MSRTTAALLAAVLSGALVAVQARVNAGLAKGLDDPLLAAVLSFVIGLGFVVAVVLARPRARAAWAAVKDVPWWTRLGGLGGASLVAVGAFAAPQIGVALLTVGLVAGQTTGGLAVDRAGIGPGGHHRLTAPRVGGAALCLGAVLISVLGKGQGDGSPLLLGLVVAAGFLISLQQALNGRVRRVTGDAGVATLVNFLIGTTALVAAYLLVSAVNGWQVDHWPGQWWLYTGGPLGASFVAVASVIVRTLGVLRLGLGVIAGQLVGAVLLDLFVPAADHGVATATLVGVALTFVAVAVSGLPPRERVPA